MKHNLIHDMSPWLLMVIFPSYELSGVLTYIHSTNFSW